MRDGELCLITLPGGYYPYVLLAWMRRVEGLEWEAVRARVVRRFGPGVSLAVLASKGPQEGTELLQAAESPELIWRPNVGRCLPCNPAAWVEHCPCPWPEKPEAPARRRRL